jgi:transposase
MKRRRSSTPPATRFSCNLRRLDISERDIGVKWVFSWSFLSERVAPKTTRRRRPSWAAWADWLKAAVARTPDAYLRELKARLKQERGIEASESVISAACAALKLTRKKRR